MATSREPLGIPNEVTFSVPLAHDLDSKEALVHADAKSLEQEPERRPEICGIHHVKLPVRDPATSRDWYVRVLGFEQEIEFVEEGVLMGVALHDPRSGVRFAVRRAPQRTEAWEGFDPVALTVTTRAELEEWVEHLDSAGIEHGPVMNGHIGWLMGFRDPDGIEGRLYTLEAPAEGENHA